MSIVIIDWKGSGSALKKQLLNQTFQDYETIVVQHVAPIARARNMGADIAKGDIVIFFDHDVILGNEYFLEKLILPFEQRANVGIIGPRQLVPDGNWIQNRLRQEGLYVSTACIDVLTEAQGIGGPCMAAKTTVFKELGYFNESVISAEDGEILFRSIKMGLKNYIVPDAFIYHPSPSTYALMLRQQFIYGRSVARVKRLCPGWKEGGVYFKHVIIIPIFLLIRTILLPVEACVPLSFAAGKLRIAPRLQFAPLKACALYLKHLGYCYEYVRIRPGYPPVPAMRKFSVEKIDERNCVVREQ
ncbi:MAG: glycosyltransferase [Candidatus Omnitrophota bacterium]